MHKTTIKQRILETTKPGNVKICLNFANFSLIFYSTFLDNYFCVFFVWMLAKWGKIQIKIWTRQWVVINLKQ